MLQPLDDLPYILILLFLGRLNSWYSKCSRPAINIGITWDLLEMQGFRSYHGTIESDFYNLIIVFFF